MYHVNHLVINEINTFERFLEGCAFVVSWNANVGIALATYPKHKTVVFAFMNTVYAFGYMIGNGCKQV